MENGNDSLVYKRNAIQARYDSLKTELEALKMELKKIDGELGYRRTPKIVLKKIDARL